MKIKLNGKVAEVVAGATLLDVLIQNQIVPELVACELNLTVIRRKNYSTRVLKEADELEIIRMIGGG